MVEDQLNRAVRRRLKELGLPPFLVELGEFHEKFFLHRWVMFVRDGDEVANVHLIQPQISVKALRCKGATLRGHGETDNR
jgi:hypothetical protein